MGYSSFIPSSSSSINFILITFCLLIPTAFSTNDTEVHSICLHNTINFTSDYNESRALVLIDLIIKTASSDGFRYTSYSWPLESPNEPAYGLALCRGDVSPDNCTACVNNSALAIIDANHCPDSRKAILWRDYCFLKYSDEDFYGKIDTDNIFSLIGDWYWNIWRTTPDALITFVDKLSQTAFQSPMLYAFGTSNITDYNVTVYGVAQCTRDLSKDDCKDCLDSARKWLPTFRRGGRLLLGSCNIRYETYNFDSSAIN